MKNDGKISFATRRLRCANFPIGTNSRSGEGTGKWTHTHAPVDFASGNIAKDMNPLSRGPRIALLLLIGLVCVCIEEEFLSSVPSDREVREMLRDCAVFESYGNVRLVSFSKLSTTRIDAPGVRIFQMGFKIEIEFQHECWWSGYEDGHWVGIFHTDPVDQTPYKWRNSNAARTGIRMPIGSRLTLWGELKFHQTEWGWCDQHYRMLGVPGREREHSVIACMSNCLLIDGAKQQWSLEFRKGSNDVPTRTELLVYLGSGRTNETFPVCPSGGTYKIGPVNKSPTCSYPGHIFD